jgi:hypothetical protein
MTGLQLWQILLTTNVPAEHLKTLAYDLYYQKPTAEGNASYAVDALAPKLAIPSKFAYGALKLAAAQYPDGTLGGDRKMVLEWLAHDYQKNSAWTAINPITNTFVEKIAHNVTVIIDAMAKQTPPTSPSPPAVGKPTNKPVAHVSKPTVAAAIAAGVVARPHALPAKAHIASVHPSAFEPKKDWRPQLLFFVGGTIASFFLAIRNAHKRQRLSVA